MRRYPLKHRVRRERRYEEAETRQEERDERTTKQQLGLLDKRLGNGKGAKAERKRLKG